LAILTFPSLIQSAYRNAISFLRTDLTAIAETARKSPGIIPDIAAALAVLTANLGVTLPAAGVPGQPTGLVLGSGGTGTVNVVFVSGVNTASHEYATSIDGGTVFGAWTALPALRRVTGIAAGSTIFRVRGLNAAGLQGTTSANSAALVVA
jgi:hypothetical protein